MGMMSLGRRAGLAFATIALIGLSGCATGVQRGFSAYNAGRYEEAYAQWLPMANAGDAAAQYNMGLLWQQGLSVQTPRNPDRAGDYFFLAARQGFVTAMAPLAEYQLSKNQPDAALTWLMLAARWNDQTAIVMLNRMGAPIPQPDLAIAQQQAQANMQASIMLVTACVVARACGAPVQTPAVTCRAQQMRDVNGNLVYRCQ